MRIISTSSASRSALLVAVFLLGTTTSAAAADGPSGNTASTASKLRAPPRGDRTRRRNAEVASTSAAPKLVTDALLASYAAAKVEAGLSPGLKDNRKGRELNEPSSSGINTLFHEPSGATSDERDDYSAISAAGRTTNAGARSKGTKGTKKSKGGTKGSKGGTDPDLPEDLSFELGLPMSFDEGGRLSARRKMRQRRLGRAVHLNAGEEGRRRRRQLQRQYHEKRRKVQQNSRTKQRTQAQAERVVEEAGRKDFGTKKTAGEGRFVAAGKGGKGGAHGPAADARAKIAAAGTAHRANRRAAGVAAATKNRKERKRSAGSGREAP